MQHCRFHFGRRVSKRFTYASSIMAAVLALGMTVSSYAFVRLANGTNGLHWNQQPIIFTISTARTSPQVPDGSTDAAVRLAFKQWQSIPSANITFSEDQNPQSRARTDWQQQDLHLVWFDNDGSSNMFSPGSGLVAVTPVSFDAFGNILDADMIFNNRDHTFSTTGQPGTFDVQNIATHEAGHFIGLDHSAIVGATMNPFAVQQDSRLRSLEKDDVAGASSVYPSGSFYGSISGSIVDGTNHVVSGAHVVAEATDGSGTPVSSTLSGNDGSFQIQGLTSGSYTVYVEPMDGPVQGGNLSLSTSHLNINTNFGTTFVGGDPMNPTSVGVTTAMNTALGSITVRPSVGMTITSSSPVAAMPGDTVTIQASGSGFQATDVPYFTGFAPNADKPFTILSSSVDLGGGGFSITVKLDAAIPLGMRSFGIHRPSTKDARVYTGGFEIRRAAPSLSGLLPATGSPGVQISLNGTNLQSGGVVIMGPGMVVNPQATGSQVNFACPNIPSGTYDVTYQNPDGQFAAITRAFVLTGGASASSGSGGSGATGTGGTTTTTTTTGSTPSSPSSTTTSSSPTDGGLGSTGGSSGFTSTGSTGGGGGGGGGGGCLVAPGSQGSSAAALPLALLGLVLVIRRRRAA